MKNLNQEIMGKLQANELGFYHFVDISSLPAHQRRNLPGAILIGLPMNLAYLNMLIDRPDYIPTYGDEYEKNEVRVGKLSDELAAFIREKGYRAISQSDEELVAEKAFNAENLESLLPHKTIALLSGAGWIGKSNLFVTPQYGAAQNIGTVLTDAPLESWQAEILASKCGNCGICQDVCDKKVLKGTRWTKGVSRDEMINVHECTTCLKCLVYCPWTRKYMSAGA